MRANSNRQSLGTKHHAPHIKHCFTILTFLFPAAVLYAAFFLFPMAQAFYVSLFRWRGLSLNKEFVGLGNFRQLFLGDPVFWTAFRHNLFFLTASLLVIVPLALFFASALARRVGGSQTYRAVYLFPNMISIVAVAVLWSFVYHPSFGILNGLLKSTGFEELTRGWLGEPGTALPAIVATSIWYSLGFYIVLFLAGIQSIPTSFYEAALIDGASHWQSFRHVTIPLLWEILKLAVVYLVINTLNIFGLVWVMTEGGPGNHTEVMLTYLYRLAFEESNFGYATAVGVFAFLLIFASSLALMRLMKREVVEY
ncbi:MAG TPA: sugar ABC transporter permease [Armatimonadota bacterium]|nr:sugar ABC transporter permease [Armatimonadota bacterium]